MNKNCNWYAVNMQIYRSNVIGRTGGGAIKVTLSMVGPNVDIYFSSTTVLWRTDSLFAANDNGVTMDRPKPNFQSPFYRPSCQMAASPAGTSAVSAKRKGGKTIKGIIAGTCENLWFGGKIVSLIALHIPADGIWEIP